MKSKSNNSKKNAKLDGAMKKIIEIGFKKRLAELLVNKAITRAAYEQALIEYNL